MDIDNITRTQYYIKRCFHEICGSRCLLCMENNMLLEKLDEILSMPTVEQIKEMVLLFGDSSVVPPAKNTKESLVFTAIVDNIFGDKVVLAKAKMEFAEFLNLWGDPRLSSPSDAAYWSKVWIDDVELLVGKFMVTIQEWQAFLSNGYDKEECWSEEGLEWKAKRRLSWQDLASDPESKKYLFANQPVVGVSWFEAEAFATFHNARLMEFYEREWIVRGKEKRPYPWGKPFRRGYANTQEEELGKPSAVGLYVFDQTPEGVFDLAGNVSEWLSDDADDMNIVHPGSWNSESISTWAKASSSVSSSARLGYLGFRIVRDC